MTRLKRLIQIALFTILFLIVVVWLYHVLIGGADPVLAAIWTVALFMATMVVALVSGFLRDRRESRRNRQAIPPRHPPSATDNNNVSTYFLYDGLGSVTGLVDAYGGLLDMYAYDAFGATRSHAGFSAN